jgi:hypothetical protein
MEPDEAHARMRALDTAMAPLREAHRQWRAEYEAETS